MSSLSPGQTLAHYRIEGRLGAGGMGEVYRATDTKLGRSVALKVLPATAAADPSARLRLLDEARSAAALTHPHVVTIYSVDSADGVDFIVMEHVSGKSLKERLAEGPLDLNELFQLGIEVADALAAAHAIGIVHRDIKPANILLTPQGSAKVLDFGIAKRLVSDSAETMGATANMTAGGMVVGSAAYMAPEQARGEALDGRVDVFSLGATLYEAATGRQAFEGSTALDTMIAVATKNPPLASLVRPDLPVDLDVILSRALAKKREDRFETPRELADALRGLREGTEAHTGTSSALRTSLPTVPNNLPTALTSFIGRSRERGEVRRLLQTARIVTVLGPGGSGKTRLAVQVAQELLGEFPDGVWLAEFEALADAALVPQQVARAAGIAEEPGVPIATTLARNLGNRGVLLVLDNCEHLAAAFGPFLTLLLMSSPSVRVLATSREALGVAGEVNWRIPTLSVPDLRSGAARSREAAGRFEAVRLFVDRAQAAQPTFQLTDQNAETVAQICHRLDGIPLAIELAAVRVKVLPVEQIQARLRDRFALLTGGSRTADPRQQTLRATVDWSYDLLSDQERKLLNRVSVFAGGFTLEGAELVCAWNGLETYDVLDLLAPLIDKSLVVGGETSAEMPRYQLLETIRDYANERLRQAGESDVQTDRHALHFFKLVLEAEPELQGPGQAAWFKQLEREADNIRLAVRYYMMKNDAGAALLMVGAIWRWWWTSGRWEEGRVTLREVLSNPAGAGPTPERARALYASAVLARGQRDAAAAATLLKESLAMAESLGDKAGVGNALFEQGNLANDRDDLAAAAELYQKSLAIRREIEDRRGASLVLHNLAVVDQARGDGASARRLFEEALELHRELGNATMEAHTLNGLTDVVLHAGDLDAAQKYLERGLGIQRELGNRHGAAFSLRQLGEVATARGDLQGARTHLSEGFEIFRSVGDAMGLVDIVDSAAKLAARIGAAERALLLAGAGASWRAAIEAPRAEPDGRSLAQALDPARAALGENAPETETRGLKLRPEDAIRLVEETLKS